MIKNKDPPREIFDLSSTPERGETTGSKILFSLSRLFFLGSAEWIPASF
jgi:hypothetical protein